MSEKDKLLRLIRWCFTGCLIYVLLGFVIAILMSLLS